MKARVAGLLGFAVLVAVLASPVVAYACPMCFDGGNSNQSAFLYGSLFLMIVPVTALGGLGYWAYRRMRAAEARDRAQLRQQQDARQGESGPSLRLVR